MGAPWIPAFAGMTEKVPSPVVLPRKEERVRSVEVETLDGVGGEGDGSEQVIQQGPVWLAWIPAFAGMTNKIPSPVATGEG